MKLFRTPRFFRWIFPKRTWGFSWNEKCVFLTFDDGPDPDLTSWILDYLHKEEIKATFFCVGANVERHPHIYQRILNDGHRVGNHTFDHSNAFKVTRDQFVGSVEKASSVISSDLFRPPYGRMPVSYDKLFSDQKIIMWTWLSYDFDRSVPIERIVRNAEKNIGPGDILVLHDNPKTEDRLRELLPELVNVIRSKGLSFEVIP